MVDAREVVQEILKQNQEVTLLCPAANIHRITAPRNNKDFPCIVIREDDNYPNNADGSERSSAVTMQVWLWAQKEDSYLSLIKAVNKALAAKRWIRSGVKPDNFLPEPLGIYEKMLLYEKAILNNE